VLSIGRTDEPVFDVAGGRIGVALRRVTPAAATTRFEDQHIARIDLDPDPAPPRMPQAP